jgi:hypothetical protein
MKHDALGNMDNESIYNKIRELFGNLDNYNVLEEEMDIELQMKYFDFAKKVKKNIDAEVIENEIEALFDKNTPLDNKKRILVYLASKDEVGAYRMIEQYVKESDEELRDWAVLALQESKMLLQSKLMDENQVFISTGLGGKGSKLRYFIVLLSKTGKEFTDVQKKMIRNEFEFYLRKNEIEIEEVHFYNNYSTILTLIPLDKSIKDIFKSTIKECNKYGDFLKSNFIVTNVKKLSFEEIDSFMNHHENKDAHDNDKFDDFDDDDPEDVF